MVSVTPSKAGSDESAIRLCVEVLLLAGFFFLVAGGAPPDVNEAHYLTKAKHYWDSSFAPHDLFLNSADVHLAFYWSIGCLTKFCSLTTTAWIGRWIVWLLIASGLISLSRSLGHRRGLGIVCGVVFFILQSNCHLAGEWVVGGVEAKGFAFGFCFLALAQAVRKHWNGVWLLLGFAVAFHVLVGGWITVLMVFHRVRLVMKSRCGDKSELLACVFGLCIGLIGFIPAWNLASSVDALIAKEANYISVHIRLSHHLLFSSFAFDRYIKFGVLCTVGLIVWWQTASIVPRRGSILVQLACLSLGLCVVGIVLTYGLDEASNLQNRLLRFYWFRTSDVLVPLATAYAAVSIGIVTVQRGVWPANLLVLLTIAMIVGPVWGFQNKRFWDPRAQGDVLALPHATLSDRHQRREVTLRIERHFLACCQWIRLHTPVDAVVITPMRQQTFKWNSHRAEVVTRKDMPQDAVGLVNWYNLRRSLYPIRDGRRGLQFVTNDEIVASANAYNASYLLISQFSAKEKNRFLDDPRFVRKFPSAKEHSYYAVYEVNRE